MQISRAKIEDAQEILELQKLAYQREAELYNDHTIPPLTQTFEEMRAQFKDHVVLKTVFEGEIIGTVRAYEEGGICHIGRLAVHLKMQNRGIGTMLIQEIEKHFDCRHFELFAGSNSHNNIHLYKKLGYSIFKASRIGRGNKIEMLGLEKHV